MEKSIQINYQEFTHYSSLDTSTQNLIVKAYEIADKAYAPYSQFHVGAVLLLEDGQLILGNNQENMAYPSGLCAERVALFYAGANFSDKKIQQLVVVAKGDLIGPDECVSPCGSCRQVIVECEKRQSVGFQVVLVSASGRTFVFEKGSDLLIFPFGI